MTDSWSWEKEKAGIQFEFRAKSVNLWEEKALSLKEASEIIYTHLVEIHKLIKQDLENGQSTNKSTYLLYVGLVSSWMLSVGYAVESLIKALIILIFPWPERIIIINEKGDKKLNMDELFNNNKPHNLNYLWKNKIREPIYRPEFTKVERLFMNKMTSFTVWRGKYPIPIKATQLTYSGQDIEQDLINAIMDRSIEYHEYMDVDKDKKAFDNVYKKILDKLSETKKIKNVVS